MISNLEADADIGNATSTNMDRECRIQQTLESTRKDMNHIALGVAKDRSVVDAPRLRV